MKPYSWQVNIRKNARGEKYFSSILYKWRKKSIKRLKQDVHFFSQFVHIEGCEKVPYGLNSNFIKFNSIRIFKYVNTIGSKKKRKATPLSVIVCMRRLTRVKAALQHFENTCSRAQNVKKILFGSNVIVKWITHKCKLRNCRQNLRSRKSNFPPEYFPEYHRCKMLQGWEQPDSGLLVRLYESPTE